MNDDDAAFFREKRVPAKSARWMIDRYAMGRDQIVWAYRKRLAISRRKISADGRSRLIAALIQAEELPPAIVAWMMRTNVDYIRRACSRMGIELPGSQPAEDESGFRINHPLISKKWVQ